MRFAVRQLFLGVCIVFLVVHGASSALAIDHKVVTEVTDSKTHNMPGLPAFKPRLGPLLTDGYHKESNFPDDKWIDVDLSEQRVVAYENNKAVNAFIVSTGLPNWPTVTGEFRIRLKTQSQTMSGGSRVGGDYYSLPNVQWVQYFYEEYAFHGAYWHNNFGRPMSHGCVNMRNEDAKWLFDWAGPAWQEGGSTWQKPTTQNQGTLVIVHI